MSSFKPLKQARASANDVVISDISVGSDAVKDSCLMQALQKANEERNFIICQLKEQEVLALRLSNEIATLKEQKEKLEQELLKAKSDITEFESTQFRLDADNKLSEEKIKLLRFQMSVATEDSQRLKKDIEEMNITHKEFIARVQQALEKEKAEHEKLKLKLLNRSDRQ